MKEILCILTKKFSYQINIFQKSNEIDKILTKITS